MNLANMNFRATYSHKRVSFEALGERGRGGGGNSSDRQTRGCHFGSQFQVPKNNVEMHSRETIKVSLICKVGLRLFVQAIQNQVLQPSEAGEICFSLTTNSL